MFEYENNTENVVAAGEEQQSEHLTWSAEEYQSQNKSFIWYATLYLVGLVLILASIFFYHKELIKMISVILVVVSIVASLHIISHKKPKTINYSMDQDIISIDGKVYSLGSFKSFSVIEQNNKEEIRLLPTSSTQPSVNLRLDEESKTKVFDLLSDNVPYEDVKISLIDRIANKLGI